MILNWLYFFQSTDLLTASLNLESIPHEQRRVCSKHLLETLLNSLFFTPNSGLASTSLLVPELFSVLQRNRIHRRYLHIYI